MPGTYRESTRANGFVAINTMPLYVYISFCEYLSLIACRTKVVLASHRWTSLYRSLPAGSFKYERLVRSSLASSIAGFIKGGRLVVVESSIRAPVVVSSVLVCWSTAVSPSRIAASRYTTRNSYPAIIQFEDQCDFLSVHIFGLHLGGNPSLRGVWLPSSCANIIVMSHGSLAMMNLTTPPE